MKQRNDNRLCLVEFSKYVLRHLFNIFNVLLKVDYLVLGIIVLKFSSFYLSSTKLGNAL